MGAKTLKWIGYITAVLSLIAGLRGVETLISGKLELRQNTESLLASERVQLQGHDYEAAWEGLEQATKNGDDAREVRNARETLAMQWLDDAHVGENQKFSDIAKKVDPVLTTGVAAATTPQHKADLLAHLGWSYFLRSRDGASQTDPSQTYAEAVKEDPNNPYAQAMWGHWILWNSRQPELATAHFQAALRSGRQRDFVRRFQVIALLNSRNPACDEELVRVVNAIRKENGSIDTDTRAGIFDVYSEELSSPDDRNRFLRAISPAEHLDTFHWLFDAMNQNDSHELSRHFDLAVLEESAGQRDNALADYQSLRKQMAGRAGVLPDMTKAAIQRLSRP